MRFNHLRRRDFITLLGGAAATWPVAARGQQPAMPVIGFLGANTASLQREWTGAFVQRLRELGWIEGRTVTIEYRWAEGRTERFAEIAAEFVQLKVDVIVTQGTSTVIAAKQATSVIPIVFASAGDPVGNDLVASLARPGGNVTGLSSQGGDTVGKRIELLREVVPGLRRLAILGNVDNPFAMGEMGEVQAAARTLGLVEVDTLEIRRGEDIAPAFEGLKGRVNALYVATDPLTLTYRMRIHTHAPLLCAAFAVRAKELGRLPPFSSCLLPRQDEAPGTRAVIDLQYEVARGRRRDGRDSDFVMSASTIQTPIGGIGCADRSDLRKASGRIDLFQWGRLDETTGTRARELHEASRHELLPLEGDVGAVKRSESSAGRKENRAWHWTGPRGKKGVEQLNTFLRAYHQTNFNLDPPHCA